MNTLKAHFIAQAAKFWKLIPSQQTAPFHAFEMLGDCPWCTIFASTQKTLHSTKELLAFFAENPCSILVHFHDGTFSIFALSPLEDRPIAAWNIAIDDSTFWSIGTNYLKFTFELDRRFGKKRVEMNFVRDFRKCYDKLGRAWKNLSHPQQAPSLTLTTLLRLLFLVFLASRSILDRRPHYLIEEAQKIDGKQLSIYQKFLRPLFFETLNKTKARRPKRSQILGDIPFLNGGLFSPTQMERDSPNLDVPNDCILDILHTLFTSYNFNNTNFNESQIQTTAPLSECQKHKLDPWMLGHIFETLLPKGIRTGSGSFYTPLPLAQQIVQRAFATWLSRHFSLPHEQAVAIVSTPNDNALSGLSQETLSEINHRLKQIRILDPAVGSGAFLQVAFEHLLHLRLKLAKALNQCIAPNFLAKQILSLNLYGIDILPEATQICELRLWLELLKYTPNDNILPLPNIDLNILCGNSLLELSHFAHYLGLSLPQPILNLSRLNRRYKFSHGKKKQELRHQIDAYNNSATQEIVQAIRQKLHDEVRILKTPIKDIFTQKLTFSRKQQKRFLEIEKQTAFIDTMQSMNSRFSFDIAFNDIIQNGGFDLILGNPPWYSISKLPTDIQDILKMSYSCANNNSTSEYCNQPADISTLFIEKSLQYLQRDGILAMLVPNKLFSAPSYQSFQAYIEQHTTVLQFQDWTESQHNAFEASTYPSSILLTPKDPHAQILPRSPWVARHEIQNKCVLPSWIQKVPRLKEYFNTKRGICTGANEIYIGKHLHTPPSELDLWKIQFKASKIPVDIERSLIRPVIRGADIRPYHVEMRDLMILPNDPLKISQPLVPLPKHANQWFEQSKERLAKRKSQNSRCFYAIPGMSPCLNQKKVVWRDISIEVEACFLQDTTAIPINTVYYIPVIDDNTGYLLAAWLNSKFIRSFCSVRAEHAQNGFKRYFAWLIQNIPWPFELKETLPYQSQMIELSKKAHRASNSQNDDIQQQLDSIIQQCIKSIEKGCTSRPIHTTHAVPLRLVL